MPCLPLLLTFSLPVGLRDEPTTAWTPRPAAPSWTCIHSVITSPQGRSVVPQNTWEECEALCTRMAIMVNGRFRCLGSSAPEEQVRCGYTIILRVAGPDPDLVPVMKFIESELPGSTLKEKHRTMLQYQLPSSLTSLAHIFSILAKNKEMLQIEDYSVTQTTLDQVFVNFAKDQSDDYHSKDNSVRRKEVAIDIPTLSCSGGAAAEAEEDKLKESPM
uniref:phospholipid-transporting ATPase ABCA1-like n=1 Tax=Centroberyx gerrardi TaxID=166262 RepID=UPI003AB063B1